MRFEPTQAAESSGCALRPGTRRVAIRAGRQCWTGGRRHRLRRCGRRFRKRGRLKGGKSMAKEEQLLKDKSISLEQLRILRELRSLTDDAVRALPDRYLQKSVRRLDYPDMPRARKAFRLAQ